MVVCRFWARQHNIAHLNRIGRPEPLEVTGGTGARVYVWSHTAPKSLSTGTAGGSLTALFALESVAKRKVLQPEELQPRVQWRARDHNNAGIHGNGGIVESVTCRI